LKLNKFIQDNLKDIIFSTKKQKQEEGWDVEGLFHNQK